MADTSTTGRVADLPSTLTQVMATARLTFTDVRRSKWMFRLLLVQPLIVLVPMVFIGVLTARELDEGRTRTFTVAVEGDEAELAPLREVLTEHRFRIRIAPDAERLVVEQRVDVGLVVPDGTAAALAGGGGADLRILAFPPRNKSRNAMEALGRALEEARRQVADDRLRTAGHPATLAAPLVIVDHDLASTTSRGARDAFGRALPILVGFFLLSILGLAEERLGGSKERRTVEPMLVLPFDRRAIVGGVAAASSALGLLGSVVVLIPAVGVGLLLVARASSSAADAGTVAAAVAASVLAVVALLSAAGVYLGATAGSQAKGSRAAVGVNVALVGATFAAGLVPDGAASRFLPVPFVGPLLLVRTAVVEGVGAAQIARGVLPTVLVAVLLLRLAARDLGGEQNVLRPAG